MVRAIGLSQTEESLWVASEMEISMGISMQHSQMDPATLGITPTVCEKVRVRTPRKMDQPMLGNI